MLVPYSCCTEKFQEHFQQQGSGLSYYHGVSRQKGYGIGGFFAKLFRSALPFLYRGAKAVGKEALRTGAMIANDVLAGENIKEAARQRSKEAGKVLAQKAIHKAQSMVGSGKYKRKRKAEEGVISAPAKKVLRRDSNPPPPRDFFE